MSLTWTIGDDEYEVIVDSFHRGSPASYDDPGDGGEVELSSVVRVWRSSESVGKFGDDGFAPDYVTFDTFVRELAIELGDTIAETEDRVHDAALEYEHKRHAEMEEDARSDPGWRNYDE